MSSPVSCTVLSPMFRRTRKPNYTHEETMVLLEQIETHRHILFGKSTNHQRAQLWTFIADTVNAVPSSAGRTVDELKHRWKDMSRRARMYARGISQDKFKSEQATFAPSIYFDAIMRIMGDDTMDGSDFNALTSTDSQNSASRFTEDSYMYPMKSEVDVKPDINIINNFLSGDMRSHNLKNQFIQKNSAHSSQNPENNQNSINSYIAAASTNHADLGIHFSRPIQHRYNTHHAPDIEANITPFSSERIESSLGNYPPWNLQMSVAASRPMRFDPITQEVTEIDDYESDSDSTDGESSSSKLVISAADKQSETAEANNVQKNSESTTSAEQFDHPQRKRLRANSTEHPLQTLSLEELQKTYLIKKIQMVNQKTLCFKLLETKLKHEISLQQQSQISRLSSHTSSVPRRGPSTCRKQKRIHRDHKDIKFDNETVNVHNLDSRAQNWDSDNCEPCRVLSDVSKDNEDTINGSEKSNN